MKPWDDETGELTDYITVSIDFQFSHKSWGGREHAATEVLMILNRAHQEYYKGASSPIFVVHISDVDIRKTSKFGAECVLYVGDIQIQTTHLGSGLTFTLEQ